MGNHSPDPNATAEFSEAKKLIPHIFLKGNFRLSIAAIFGITPLGLVNRGRNYKFLDAKSR